MPLTNPLGLTVVAILETLFTCSCVNTTKQVIKDVVVPHVLVNKLHSPNAAVVQFFQLFSVVRPVCRHTWVKSIPTVEEDAGDATIHSVAECNVPHTRHKVVLGQWKYARRVVGVNFFAKLVDALAKGVRHCGVDS